MSDSKMSRDFQYLACAILLIFGFFAFRSYAVFMRSLEICQGTGEELSVLHQFLFNSYRWLPLALLLVWLVAMASVWFRYRMHSLVVSVGIVVLAGASHVLNRFALEPILKMLEGMAA